MSYYFGLYFGNTNLCIAVCKNDKWEVLANSAGDRETPAYAALIGDEVCVGLPAKQYLRRDPNNVLTSIKDRLLNLETEGDVEKSRNENVKLNPYKALVMLFSNMVSIARNHSHENDVPVVVTVPQGFPVSTKKLIEKAVVEAGFRFLRMISEPSAALLAYDIGEDLSDANYNCLVYRLGGTSSDVSVFQVYHGIYRSLASVNLKDFGGHNFTKKLVDFVSNEFSKMNRVNIEKNSRSQLKLNSAAETCKHGLSIMQSSLCFAESVYEGIDLSVNISRARFESLISSELQRSFETIMQTIEEANLDIAEISKVILTGGSCKIPKLQQFLSDKFPLSTILVNITPDETMAIGASKEASLVTQPISQQDCYICTLANDIYLRQLKDTEIIDDVLLFEKGVLIPTSCQKTLSVVDSRPSTLEICEKLNGSSKLDFQVLGKFSLPSSSGLFSIDAEVMFDQRLKIICKDIETNFSKLFII